MTSLVAYLDGDIDAFVAAARVKELRFPLHQAVHVQYGEGNICVKTEYADTQARYLGFDLMHIFLDVQRSELVTSDLNVVEIETVPYIPHRNLLIASYIANYKYDLCDGMVFGWHANQSPYPDTTIEFQRALSRVLNVGGEKPYTVHLPLMMYTAEEVGEMGMKLFGEDLAKLTWSCSVSGNIHCGECAGCLYRQRVFGNGDPTAYKVEGGS